MVRATAAEVEDLLGTYPSGWDATRVGELCTSADYYLDGYVKTFYNTTLSTTDSDVVNIANHIVIQMLHRANAVHRGADILPAIFTEEIKMLIAAVLGATTNDGIYAGDMCEDD